ncbi:MAG: RHS repeat-associated core domain-containing protein, partial [Acidobacteriota bacterium]
PNALRDLFGKTLAVGLSLTFAWPVDAAVIEDHAVPRLEEVCIDAGKVRVSFSEVPDPSLASSELLLGGLPVAWTPSADGYSLESSVPLSSGIHTLTLGTGPLDLQGQEGLSESQSWTFEFGDAASSVSLFDSLAVASASALGNEFGFHGLQHDEVTGFVYARNRYLDPETGRFVSVDPYGYIDGPSTYQYALNNPASFSDPTGEIAVLDNVVGGAVSVAVGVSLTCMTVGCEGYSLSDAAIDFGLGFATSGLSSLGNLRHLASGTAGTARFGSRVAGEVGLDVGAEYLRHTIAHPGEEISFGRLVTGGLVNLGIGEAGAFSSRIARLHGSHSLGLSHSLDGVTHSARHFRVKTGLRAGSSSAGGRSLGEAIAQGHAFDSHIHEFLDLGIETVGDLARHINEVVAFARGRDVKKLARGRIAYWDRQTETIVIHDPSAVDLGTAFIPRRGRQTFERLE